MSQDNDSYQQHNYRGYVIAENRTRNEIRILGANNIKGLPKTVEDAQYLIRTMTDQEPIPRCNTCKHWNDPYNYFGTCAIIQEQENVKAMDGGEVETHMMFGCINHEKGAF